MSVPFAGVMVHLQSRLLSYKPGLSLSRGWKCPTGPVKTVPQFNGIPIIQTLIYFYTATKEISWILLTMTIKLMLSRPLIRLLGTSMTF